MRINVNQIEDLSDREVEMNPVDSNRDFTEDVSINNLLNPVNQTPQVVKRGYNQVQLTIKKNNKKSKKNKKRFYQQTLLPNFNYCNTNNSLLHAQINNENHSSSDVEEIIQPQVSSDNRKRRFSETSVEPLCEIHYSKKAKNDEIELDKATSTNCEESYRPSYNEYGFEEFTGKEKRHPYITVIIQDKYPDTIQMTDYHLNIIRQLINHEIDKLPYGAFTPTFFKSYVKNGVILIQSSDEKSQYWLRQIVPKLRPDGNIKLTTTFVDKLFKRYECHFWVDYEVDAIKVLNRIQKQNKDLNMTSWELYSQEIQKGQRNGILVTVGIPRSSIEVLKCKSFKVHHGLELIYINVIDKSYLSSNKKRNHLAGPSSSY